MVFASSLHAEIYDSYEELLAVHPVRGVLLIADPAAASGLAQIQAAGIYLPTIAYGLGPVTREIVEVMNLGAINYLDWPFTGRTLVPALEDARTTGKQKASEAQAFAVAHDLVERLSPRERQVLICLVDGQRNKEIAETLQISPRTVEIHRGNMMKKLDVETVAEAIKIAIRAGLDGKDVNPGEANELTARRAKAR